MKNRSTNWFVNFLFVWAFATLIAASLLNPPKPITWSSWMIPVLVGLLAPALLEIVRLRLKIYRYEKMSYYLRQVLDGAYLQEAADADLTAKAEHAAGMERRLQDFYDHGLDSLSPAERMVFGKSFDLAHESMKVGKEVAEKNFRHRYDLLDSLEDLLPFPVSLRGPNPKHYHSGKREEERAEPQAQNS